MYVEKSKGRKLSEIIGILPNILKCIVNAKTLLCSCFILGKYVRSKLGIHLDHADYPTRTLHKRL